MTLVSPVFVWKFGATSLLEKYSIAELIGLRTTGKRPISNENVII